MAKEFQEYLSQLAQDNQVAEEQEMSQMWENRQYTPENAAHDYAQMPNANMANDIRQQANTQLKYSLHDPKAIAEHGKAMQVALGEDGRAMDALFASQRKAQAYNAVKGSKNRNDIIDAGLGDYLKGMPKQTSFGELVNNAKSLYITDQQRQMAEFKAANKGSSGGGRSSGGSSNGKATKGFEPGADIDYFFENEGQKSWDFNKVGDYDKQGKVSDAMRKKSAALIAKHGEEAVLPYLEEQAEKNGLSMEQILPKHVYSSHDSVEEDYGVGSEETPAFSNAFNRQKIKGFSLF